MSRRARHLMWMGPRAREQWVPVPKTEPDYTRVGFTSQSALLNGGTYLKQSKGAHNVFAWEWNSGSWDDLMPLRDMADGVYDTADGVNLLYFIEPTAKRRNVLPQHWATPALAVEDAPSLLPGTRPTRYVIAQPSTRGLPSSQANYAQPPDGYSSRRLYVPIPPGHTAHFGWLGAAATDGMVRLDDVQADGTLGGSTHPTVLSGGDGDDPFLNTHLTRDDSARIGLEISLEISGPTRIRAMVMQMRPTGEPLPVASRWMSGMGHSGCQFVSSVGLTPTSVPLDLVAATATLEETGDWL